MNFILPIIQIIISVLLVGAILLQQRGSGLGGIFGGGGESYHTKRGFEKILFTSTIILATLFLLSTFVALLIK
ncbi:MAG: preprotein translocase subunit SecG [Candidatus Tagabacteria bacterium CG09_land_8_20_14_0_10_41_14]|uniref:Protein-export membrane protein SecG n=2 Tax=Candidatus Tagaibacteriota TaxID=1817918 RepID=A0A2H0WNL9_9BACT|nr:MAG: preprotein translocase subunit SecG [Candidatus Tagabacteria bacterium CG09_land_8_20_14_0_10_41_14]PJE73053.1 MAG: preprotein translocase subunit SecG [Candidatus Tagabacteria bacterium CG10_big_fil_rev_8_21_14_0_10_40_13]